MPKVAVIGAGHVGATTAHLLALKSLADVTLIDIVEGLAEGKALDIQQSAPVEGFKVSVRGTVDLAAVAQSQVVVVTAGLARKPGMSRDDLVAANAKIVGPICAKVAEQAPTAVIVIVTNPLDVMVALAQRSSGFPRERVIGMAGVLDSARLRTFIALKAGVAPQAVEAMILGSHGDLMVAVRRSIKIQGKPATQVLSAADLEALCERAKNGGAEIVKLLKTGSAYYAPASSVVQMVEAILKDSRVVLPVCVALQGEYGLKDVCLGVPVELGASGMQRIIEIELSVEERQALHAAAQQVEEMVGALPAA
jgi:malate dehydrogenase